MVGAVPHEDSLAEKCDESAGLVGEPAAVGLFEVDDEVVGDVALGTENGGLEGAMEGRRGKFAYGVGAGADGCDGQVHLCLEAITGDCRLRRRREGYDLRVSPSSNAMKVVHAVCSHDCPDSCGVLVTVDQASGRAVKLQGDPSHPVTRGFLCGKVAKYLDRVYSPDRLLYPMRRKAGVAMGPLAQGREAQAFVRISWDEALDEIAARLTKITAEFGPESVLPYSYAGTIGQLGYGSMDRRFFYRLGASQLDRTICSTAGGMALTGVYGVKLGTTPQDFAHAGLILAWGANIHGNNVHLWPFVEEARRRGAKLVVIDPYRTRTAALADEHLAINPGTDAALALGMMHVILSAGLEDREYVERCTAGFEELKAHALREEHSSERVAAVTGVPAETIVRLAWAYALAGRGRDSLGPAAIRLNYGIQRSENGGTAARAVCMLPLLTGAWKYKGGGLQLSTSGSFPFNSNKLQMPELMRSSPLGRPARVVNMSQLGQALTTLGNREEEGPRVKALFVYNSNPAAIAPNQNDVLRGMLREDLFTVVHEQFFTDTADYANVLLPAPTFLEVKDVQGAYGHLFAQVSERAIAPLGEARSNVALFGELARRMGFAEDCFEDGEDELIDQVLDTGHPWFDGITRERLEREGHVSLKMPVDSAGEVLPFSTAEWFKTPSGRGELVPVPVFEAPLESRAHAAEGEYPLEFLPRKADNYMNTTFANIPVHQRMESRTAGVLEMHEIDATARAIVSGDAVEVFNARGRLGLRALVNERVGAGVVAARLDWNKLSADGGNVNALTSETLTDIGGGPTFYSTLVEVRKVRKDAC
jgi:anaerobic selenocysteine-containing dehydrogenase